MNRLVYALLTCIIVTLLIACNKSHSSIQSGSKSSLNFTVTDSVLPNPSQAMWGYNYSRDEYIFNDDSELVKHIYYSLISGAPVMGWNDSFAYANGNMVKSYFMLDSSNSSTPYTTSEYDYSGHTLTGSRYYLRSVLLVHSVYVADSTGKITSFTQYSDNSTYQYTPTSSYKLYYDSNDNLSLVTNSSGYPLYRFLQYDTHPNPWYKLPFDFAYNVLDYCPQVFSKNNYGLTYTYTIGDSTSQAFSFNYSNDGRVFGFVFTPSNGRVTNGPGISHYRTIQYQANSH